MNFYNMDIEKALLASLMSIEKSLEVVVSKIDKVTPTAPVLTGGSDSDTSSCVTIQIGKAGTTGPSGIQKYEAELENMLNGAYIHRSYNQITYKDNT